MRHFRHPPRKGDDRRSHSACARVLLVGGQGGTLPRPRRFPASHTIGRQPDHRSPCPRRAVGSPALPRSRAPAPAAWRRSFFRVVPAHEAGSFCASAAHGLERRVVPTTGRQHTAMVKTGGAAQARPAALLRKPGPRGRAKLWSAQDKGCARAVVPGGPRPDLSRFATLPHPCGGASGSRGVISVRSAPIASGAPQRRCTGQMVFSCRRGGKHRGRTRSGGRWPSMKVLMLMMTFSPMSTRPSMVAEPICGSSTTLPARASFTSFGLTAGSCSNTSRPAPAMSPASIKPGQRVLVDHFAARGVDDIGLRPQQLEPARRQQMIGRRACAGN